MDIDFKVIFGHLIFFLQKKFVPEKDRTKL